MINKQAQKEYKLSCISVSDGCFGDTLEDYFRLHDLVTHEAVAMENYVSRRLFLSSFGVLLSFLATCSKKPGASQPQEHLSFGMEMWEATSNAFLNLKFRYLKQSKPSRDGFECGPEETKRLR